MYTVMIVDDEKAIRNNLPHALDFHSMGFQVSAVAKNGRDALEQLGQTPVDLLFLDVCMPVLDGIGLLRELSAWKESDRPFVVMLSGYSDFEYARAAIQYGVKGYLLKPVDEDEALELLKRLRTELDARSQQRALAGLSERVSLLRELYHSGDGDRERFAGCTLVHAIALSQGEGGLSALRRTVEEHLPGGAEAFLRSRGSMASYLLAPLEAGETRRNALLLVRHIAHLAEQRGLACAFLLDAEIFRRSESAFRVDFEEHLYCMESEVFWGGGSVLSADAPPRRLTAQSEQRIEDEEGLLRKLRSAVLEAQEEELRAVFTELTAAVEERRLHLVLLQELCYRIYYTLSGVLSELGIDAGQFLPLDLRDAPVFLRAEEWKAELWRQLSSVLALIAQERKSQRAGVAEQAAAYVRAHFREPITLKSVADACFVSSAYLGRCFQKAMGVSLKQYLNDLRLAEAKRLLLQTDLRVYEVAEAAGFGESKHLVSKFTAQFGCSPAEYRRTQTGGGEGGI